MPWQQLHLHFSWCYSPCRVSGRKVWSYETILTNSEPRLYTQMPLAVMTTWTTSATCSRQLRLLAIPTGTVPSQTALLPRHSHADWLSCWYVDTPLECHWVSQSPDEMIMTEQLVLELIFLTAWPIFFTLVQQCWFHLQPFQTQISGYITKTAGCNCCSRIQPVFSILQSFWGKVINTEVQGAMLSTVWKW